MSDVLKRAIEQSGLTYRQLREATGMSLNRISLLVRQASAPATLGEIGLLSEALGIPASELMAEAESLVAQGKREAQLLDDASTPAPQAVGLPGKGAVWSRPGHEPTPARVPRDRYTRRTGK